MMMGEEYLEKLDCLPDDMESGSDYWEMSSSDRSSNEWEKSGDYDYNNKTGEPTEKDLADLLMSIVNETCPQY